MTDARAEFLQWFGLLAAALTWTGQLVVGYGLTTARCGATRAWGIDLHDWELALTAAAALLALTAEAAALTVLARTRGVEDSGEPPVSRRRFFAVAAALGNSLFLVAILLSGLGVLALSACRQA